MLKRLKTVAHNWLVALDQLAFVTLAAPKYLCFGGQAPSPQETISSKTGRMANEGKRWAIVAQFLIDKLFEALGGGKNHCQRAIVTESDWKNYRQ